jgi:ribosome biogenesis GTPase / thiamine phosphate phosphatase
MPTARASNAEFDARVIASFGRHHLLEDEGRSVWSATRRGRRGDVVVGDCVRARAAAAGQATIEAVHPRRTLLFRADAVRTKELAANIDLVLIVYAARPSFNRWFVWKALVAAAAAGIEAAVVQNKTDLPDAAGAAATRRELADLGWTTVAVSAAAEPQGARATLAALTRGRTSLLVGQSGMGKSTLLNLLAPDANARTQEYSERLNLGKQTTTASRWFALPHDGALVDTPGFSEFGLAHVAQADLAATFPEFRELPAGCRFIDCRHLAEPDCAVRAAVDAGRINADRYAFYKALAGAPQR